MRKTTMIAVVSFLLGGFATYAIAAERQPHMHAAIGHLEQALSELRAATADKGGHRVKAIELVESAIAQTKEGIEYDNTHNGPGENKHDKR